MFDNPYFWFYVSAAVFVVIGISIAALAYLAITAPIGREDENGYHDGDEM